MDPVKEIQLKYYGHSAFQLTKENTSLVFDPFITDNPLTAIKPEAIKCNYILVSHGHSDHLGDTVKIANQTGATVIATYELAGLVAKQGCKTYSLQFGGKVSFDFGTLRLTPALHGSGVPGGLACGFIVNFYGKTIYFAGDTGLFGDMELLGKSATIDYAILPIGGRYTMGPDEALEAVGMLKPQYVIPMHYNTWPEVEQSPTEFKSAVEKCYPKVKVMIIDPNQALILN
ncbi:MAG TPA: metal-dependent hydrolase [Bacillota bacterium]|nr:metal-dependent hydrolase [Bacillota bacterium]HPO98023.1 metal-dependent hydrolase [Bacillota bacterium]